MTYEVYVVTEDSGKEYGPKIGDVRVRFPETGDDFCTEIDEAGQRYFSIPNIINPKYKEGLIERLFIGKIRDAYEAIVQGHGDAIGQTQIFGPLGFKNDDVRKYIDREYGEDLRLKTLEGWKDAVFGFNVVFGYNSSFSGARPICDDDTVYSALCDEPEKIRFFETEEDAQLYVDETLKIVQPIVDEYNACTTEDERSVIIDKYFSTREKLGTLTFELFYAMTGTGEDGEKLKSTFEPRQAVKIKKIK